MYRLNNTFLIALIIFLGANESLADFPKDPITSFMNLIGQQKYEELPKHFSADRRKFWEESSMSNDIIEIRETIGDTWGPEETNWMNWQTPQGVVIQKTYRLQNNFRSEYSLSLTSRELNDSFKIVLINATTPYEAGAPNDAIVACNKYISHIQAKKFSEARKMVLPPTSQEITNEVYQMVRPLLVTNTDEPAELSKEGYRALLNGVWYDAIVVTPKKGGFLQHLTIYLSLVNGKYSVVTLEFKNPQIVN